MSRWGWIKEHPTDVWSVLDRATGEFLYTIRLTRDLPEEVLERVPFKPFQVIYNPRTEQVIY